MPYTAAQQAAVINVRAPLKAKPMLGKITDGEVTFSKAGNEQGVIRITPLENNQPLTSMTLRHYLPKISDAVTEAALGGDSKAQQSMAMAKRKAYQFFRATDKTFPTYAEKVQAGVWRNAAGATMDYDQSRAYNNSVDVAILDALSKLDTETIKKAVGQTIFFQPQEADENGQFVSWIAGEYDGGDYLTSGLVDEDKQRDLVQKALTQTGAAA